MGKERGAANLQRFNAARSAHVLPSLRHELHLCKKRKLEFKSIGLLAAYLSDRLKIHRTTILRNLEYRVVLLEYLSSQPGVVARTPDTTVDPTVLHAKLAAARLEASNLREEVKRLNAQLARHMDVRSVEGGAPGDVDFGNLAMLLVNVLARVGDSISVDHKERAIVDLAAKPSERVVAGPDRAGSFISWLEQNQMLPLIRLLRGQQYGSK